MAHQISVFIENKVGHFERVARILRKSEINIRSMSINDTANGWGILNLLVSDPQKAYLVLKNEGVSVALRKVVALKMRDEVGGLDDLLMQVASAGVNFNNAVGRIVGKEKLAVLLLDVDNYAESVQKLRNVGAEFIADELVYGEKE